MYGGVMAETTAGENGFQTFRTLTFSYADVSYHRCLYNPGHNLGPNPRSNPKLYTNI